MDANVSQALKPTACAVWCIVLLVPTSTNAKNYPSRKADLEDSRVNIALIIADLRPKLFADLPPAELAIYSEIRFSVSFDDKVINAYATFRAGIRRVILTEAIGRATELNGDAFLMEQLSDQPGFLSSYMSYVSEQYQKNSGRHAEGLARLRIPTPYDFAHWSEKDIDEFYSDSDINAARNVVLSGAFAFLLAHEVGHHVKGHVDHPAADLAGRREQEFEADAWAIDLLVRKKLNPVDGIIPLLFFFYTDQHPVSTERLSDHPADARRLLQMYERLSQRWPSFKPNLLGIDHETVRESVDFGISLIKEEGLGGRWSPRTRGDDQIFEAPAGITVRLHENARRVLQSAVDSPSRD